MGSPRVLVLLARVNVTAATLVILSWPLSPLPDHWWGPRHTPLPEPGTKAAVCSPETEPPGQVLSAVNETKHLAHARPAQSCCLLRTQPHVVWTHFCISTWDTGQSGWVLRCSSVLATSCAWNTPCPPPLFFYLAFSVKFIICPPVLSLNLQTPKAELPLTPSLLRLTLILFHKLGWAPGKAIFSSMQREPRVLCENNVVAYYVRKHSISWWTEWVFSLSSWMGLRKHMETSC